MFLCEENSILVTEASWGTKRFSTTRIHAAIFLHVSCQISSWTEVTHLTKSILQSAAPLLRPKWRPNFENIKFCHPSARRIVKNRTFNFVFRILHHNKRGPGGIGCFSILYFVFRFTIWIDLTIVIQIQSDSRDFHRISFQTGRDLCSWSIRTTLGRGWMRWPCKRSWVLGIWKFPELKNSELETRVVLEKWPCFSRTRVLKDTGR